MSGSGKSGVFASTGTTGTGPWVGFADTNTPIPGGSGNFPNFGIGLVSISGTSMAFNVGGGGSFFGTYVSDGTTVTRIADTNTAIPDGSGNFQNFGEGVGFDGDLAVIFGRGSGLQRGLYFTLNGGPLTKLIAVGDPLDGSTVMDLTFSRHGVDGGHVAFAAELQNGRQGVYLSSQIGVPEPSTLALGALALGAAGFARWQCRGRKTVVDAG
jgi:hypothetical protein